MVRKQIIEMQGQIGVDKEDLYILEINCNSKRRLEKQTKK